jgi:hypothetical protein
LYAIAQSQVRAGDAQAALATAQSISHEGARLRALLEIAESQAKAGDAQAARRFFAVALAAATSISDEGASAGAFGAIAESQAKAGAFSDIGDTVAFIRIDRNQHLPQIAAVLIYPAVTDPAARERFLLLLPECAPYLDAALSMCGHLATLFPASAAAIANVVTQLPAD